MNNLVTWRQALNMLKTGMCSKIINPPREGSGAHWTLKEGVVYYCDPQGNMHVSGNIHLKKENNFKVI